VADNIIATGFQSPFNFSGLSFLREDSVSYPSRLGGMLRMASWTKQPMHLPESADKQSILDISRMS